MSSVDQFESAFRSASKAVYVHEVVPIRRVLFVTDLDTAQAEAFAARARGLLRELRPETDAPATATWRVVTGDEFATVGDLLRLVDDAEPDLICSYRHLHSEGWRWPHTLSDYTEVLTQATNVPVLVLPHPRLGELMSSHALENLDRVMAMTDHLTGDDRLVNFATRFTAPGGTLYLSHVEDDTTFQRFVAVISKIDTIDTDNARETIRAQLLKEPDDYIASCRARLEADGVDVRVEAHVAMGHRLREYEAIIEANKIDLLVLNTKDEDQLAMHGIAYPLAVELTQIPLLML